MRFGAVGRGVFLNGFYDDCRQRSVSTIGEGGDTTIIPSPGRSSKQPLSGIGLHDPLHGRQACPEFNSFHQGVDQRCPRERPFSCHLPKRGQICDIPSPPKSLNDSTVSKPTSGLLDSLSYLQNLNASRPSEHPPVRGKNVKTFTWDHRLQRQNPFMAFKRVPRWCSNIGSTV